MIEIKSVRASASANAAPVFALAGGGWLEVFEGSTEFVTMLLLDNSGQSVQWRQPRPELTFVDDDLEDDIKAGLAALNEPEVATWESVKERLGL